MPSCTVSDTEVESDSGGFSGSCKKQKNKPLMEKKRRARINRSLSQLKQILIQDEHKNSSQHSKWEKADILEMTVEYLQQLRSSRPLASTSSGESPSMTPTTSSGGVTMSSGSGRMSSGGGVTSSGVTTSSGGAPSVSPPIFPLGFPMNPMIQQYMAFQQLAQLNMYQSMMTAPGIMMDNNSKRST